MNTFASHRALNSLISIVFLASFGAFTAFDAAAKPRAKAANPDCMIEFSPKVLTKAPDIVRTYEKWHPKKIGRFARVLRILVEGTAKSIPEKLVPYPKKAEITPSLFEAQLREISVSDVFLDDIDDILSRANSFSDLSSYMTSKHGRDGEKKLINVMNHYQFSMTELFKFYVFVRASGHALDAGKVMKLLSDANYTLAFKSLPKRDFSSFVNSPITVIFDKLISDALVKENKSTFLWPWQVRGGISKGTPTESKLMKYGFNDFRNAAIAMGAVVIIAFPNVGLPAQRWLESQFEAYRSDRSFGAMEATSETLVSSAEVFFKNNMLKDAVEDMRYLFPEGTETEFIEWHILNTVRTYAAAKVSAENMSTPTLVAGAEVYLGQSFASASLSSQIVSSSDNLNARTIEYLNELHRTSSQIEGHDKSLQYRHAAFANQHTNLVTIKMLASEHILAYSALAKIESREFSRTKLSDGSSALNFFIDPRQDSIGLKDLMEIVRTERHQQRVIVREAMKDWLYSKPDNDKTRKEYLTLVDGTYVFTEKAELLIAGLTRNLTHEQILKIISGAISQSEQLNSFKGQK